jgi:hypothetical protein
VGSLIGAISSQKVTFVLPLSSVTARTEFGYLLEHPSIPRYEARHESDDARENVPGADNQQERPDVIFIWNPQRLYAKHLVSTMR